MTRTIGRDTGHRVREIEDAVALFLRQNSGWKLACLGWCFSPDDDGLIRNPLARGSTVGRLSNGIDMGRSCSGVKLAVPIR